MRILAVAALLVAWMTASQVSAAPWTDFEIIEYQPRSDAQLGTLKSLGVTAGMAPINRSLGVFNPASPVPAGLRAHGLGYYVENIATDFYAAYHIWTPGKQPGWRFAALKRRYEENPSDLSVFLRDPSLSDPTSLDRITSRLTAVARAAAPDHPLYYCLGDETGIAELAAPWDFDLSEGSLTGFRTWLRTQYPSLDALNAEWGTHYRSWDEATPELTSETVNSPSDNFARWSDFKAWMDVAFASALHAGAEAVRRGDPDGRAAIEGAQIPGWGGYDYTLLSHAVDVMEIYDTDENLAIVRSLNPAVITLTTAFNAGPRQLNALWRAFLRGTRGVILYDDKSRIVTPDGQPGPDAAGYKAVFAALRGTLGDAILHATPIYDPIAILYSPASFRIQWMLEQRPQGQSWATRSLEDDWRGNGERENLALYAQTLTHLGLTPRYVSPAGLSLGELEGVRVLILPHAVALSPRERDMIKRFADHGGIVIADTPPGGFDEHGKPATVMRDTTIIGPDDAAMMASTLAAANIRPRFPVSPDEANVTTYAYAAGPVAIVAFQRDFAAPATDTPFTVSLPATMDVTDLRTGARLGRTDHLSFTLDAVSPAVFALRAVSG